MAEQAADGVEVEAAHHRVAGEGVAAVVDAHVVEPRERAELVPAVAEVGHRPLARAVGEDEGRRARQGGEHGARGRGKLERLRPGLGIGQQRAGAAYPVPPQAGDFGGPRAGEQQQPDGGGGLGVLRVVEDEAEALELIERQEALAGLHLVAAHAATGIGALGPEVPELGLAHHDGEHGQGPVGVAGRGAHGVEPARHVGAGDVGDAHGGEERHPRRALEGFATATASPRSPPASRSPRSPPSSDTYRSRRPRSTPPRSGPRPASSSAGCGRNDNSGRRRSCLTPMNCTATVAANTPWRPSLRP